MKKKVNKTGADRFTLAVARVDPKENPARYYTLTSVKTGIPDGAIRDSIVDYASGFLGTVWKEEGISLCEGIDTSEFVEQIYEAYGYNVTDKDGNIQEQGKVSVDQAKPGDVICYGSGEETSAAGIYVGDGMMTKSLAQLRAACSIPQNGTVVWYLHSKWGRTCSPAGLSPPSVS